MAFLKLISQLPLWFLYLVSNLITFLLHNITSYRKKVILDNLSKAFPEKSEAERRKICKQFYRNLSDVFVESVKTLTISHKQLQQRIRVIDQHKVTNYLDNGQSIIALASHQSNWEWLLLGNQVHMPNYTIDAGYKPLSNHFSEKLFKTIRTRFGSHLIASNQILRQMVARKNIVRPVALVADQRPAPEGAYWTTFFNQPTGFLLGSDKLPKMMNYPVFFTEMVREKRGHYAIRYHLLAQPPYKGQPTGSIIELYATAVEEAIRRNPSDWLWSHKRWKHQMPKGTALGAAKA